MSSAPSQPTSSSLLDDPQAWSLVLQWAEDKILYTQLADSLTKTFGHRYIYAEWKDVFDRVFGFSDPGEDIEDADRIPLAIAAIEAAMASRGVSLAQPGPSSLQALQAALPPSVDKKGKGKRKTTDGAWHSRPKKRTRSTSVNHFLDLEAEVDGEEDPSEDEEDLGFIVNDDDDLDNAPRHGGILPTRVYPATECVGLSGFQQAVDKIAHRLMPSSLDDLDDAEYHRRHDEFYGINCDDSDENEGELNGNRDLKALDAVGIWEAIHDWMFGTMSYPSLLELIDFQYDFNPKIQYWEDFLSRLTLADDLERRESLFASVPLADHIAHIANYRPGVSRPESPEGESVHMSAVNVVPQSEGVQMWAVNVVPRTSVDYVRLAWGNASIRTITHKFLPSRVTVYASYPNQFLQAIPDSHRSCIRGWSLIPLEDRIWQSPCEQPNPPVPGWYTVSKRGIYRDDIGYAIYFDPDTTELHLLVVPRRLKLRRCPDDALGEDHNTRCLFSPDVHRGRPHSLYRNLPRYQYSHNTFVSGLLLMRLKLNQVQHAPTPSPHQIALHVTSMVDPPFMRATQQKFNQLYWKLDDRVMVSDASHCERRGNLVSIDLENQSTVVCFPEGPEHELPLSSLSRLHSVGDVVRVVTDPFSDSGNVHHQNMGRSGIICEVDPLVDDITVKDSRDSEFRVPGFLLESHIPDQAVYAPISALTPSTTHEDSVQIGDLVEVRNGPYQDIRGYVTEVQRLAGTLTFTSSNQSTYGRRFVVPITAVLFSPDYRVLKWTADRGYNVRRGEAVVIMRGDHMGKMGTVSRVRLEEKLLDISWDMNPHVIITLPILHCAHAHSVQDNDENDRLREKEVIIIAGPNKGWQGTLVSSGRDTCVVARAGRILETYKKDSIVVRGLASTLAGRHLTPHDLLQISAAFSRADVPNPPERVKTPLPEPQSDSWAINDSERELLNSNRPRLTIHDFMLHPDILKSLERVRAVFQISPGWRDTYTGRLAKTEVPSPFEAASGPVASGHLAVRLTARTKGAHLMQETVPETSLEIYRPVKKNTLCMVINGTEGGEPIGSLLSVTRASSKEQRVNVQRLDGSSASEDSLPFSRVIVVEIPE